MQGCEMAATGGRWGPASPAPCQEGGRRHLRVDTPRGGMWGSSHCQQPHIWLTGTEQASVVSLGRGAQESVGGCPLPCPLGVPRAPVFLQVPDMQIPALRGERVCCICASVCAV